MSRLYLLVVLLKICFYASPNFAAERIVGVTVDSIKNYPATVQALSKLSQYPTARIVFDEFVPAADYAAATKHIHSVAHVMGELLDSSAFPKYSREAYEARTREYVEALGKDVDIWEIGNELNGEWLGESADVASKAAAAFDVVRTAGHKTALTLVYNEGCADRPDHELFPWAKSYVPDRMKQNIDYVFLSFYEDDCPIAKPNWIDVYERLGQLFPRAQLGFGEVGTRVSSRKIEFIQTYYKLRLPHPRYVGGYFWWYFLDDMVPESKPLWKILNEAI